ncbi:hypothetical protein ACQGAO_31755 [Rhodococcus sp. 1.20]
MSPYRSGNHTEQHYTATVSQQPVPTRPARAAPHPDVVAAAEFLLAEPDAYLYRRRYLELITHTTGPDGTTLADYTAAEISSHHCRPTQKSTPTPAPYPSQLTEPAKDVPASNNR